MQTSQFEIPPLPSFLIISAEARNAAWERKPPKPMPKFGKTSDEEARDKQRKALAEQAIADEKAAAKRKVGTKPAAAPKMDVTGMRWDGRRGKWVADMQPERTMPVTVAAAPVVEQVKPTPKTAAVAKIVKKSDKQLSATQAKMYELLTRPEGATQFEIGDACGWKPHTARANVSVVRKQYNIATESEERGTVYRLLERK